MTTNGSEVAPLIGPLHSHIESFLDHLQTNGYARESITNKRSIAIAFARWSQRERIGVENISEHHLAAFVKRRPPRPSSAVEMRALRQFLTHLRVEHGLPFWQKVNRLHRPMI